MRPNQTSGRWTSQTPGGWTSQTPGGWARQATERWSGSGTAALTFSATDSPAISAGSPRRAATDPDQPDASTGPSRQTPQKQARREKVQSFSLINIARRLTQSGRSKAGFLSDQAELKSSLFLGVCETWLSPEIADAEVCHDFPGYSIFRGDRENRQGGGVALYLTHCQEM